MAPRHYMIGLVVVALVLAALTVFVAGRREAADEALFPPTGQFIDLGGRQVHYVQQGAGPDLVLIHGASGNLRDFTFSLMPLLAERYRVTAFDRPGLGYTDRTDPAYDSLFSTASESPSEQAAMLHSAALALGIDRPLVLGHSYGNAVALAWAIEYPNDIAGLIDVSGVSLPWPGALSPFYSMPGTLWGGLVLPPLAAAWVPYGRVHSVIEGTFDPEPMPPGYAEYLGAELVLRPDSLRANARQVASLRPHIVEMSAHYGDLDLPVEILHGSADSSVPLHIHSGPLSQIIPGARLTVIDGGGHMIHQTHPDAVIAAVDRAAERALALGRIGQAATSDILPPEADEVPAAATGSAGD